MITDWGRLGSSGKAGENCLLVRTYTGDWQSLDARDAQTLSCQTITASVRISVWVTVRLKQGHKNEDEM